MTVEKMSPVPKEQNPFEPSLPQLRTLRMKFSAGMHKLEDLFQEAKLKITKNAKDTGKSSFEGVEDAESRISQLKEQILRESDQMLQFGAICNKAFSVKLAELSIAGDVDRQGAADLKLAIRNATMVFVGQLMLLESIVKDESLDYLLGGQNSSKFLKFLSKIPTIEAILEKAGAWIRAHPWWTALIIGSIAATAGLAAGFAASSLVIGGIVAGTAGSILTIGVECVKLLSTKITKLHSLSRSEDFLKVLQKICETESQATDTVLAALRELSEVVSYLDFGSLRIELNEDLGRCVMCQDDFKTSDKVAVNEGSMSCSKHYIHERCYWDWKNASENCRRRTLNCSICNQEMKKVHFKTLCTNESEELHKWDQDLYLFG